MKDRAVLHVTDMGDWCWAKSRLGMCEMRY